MCVLTPAILHGQGIAVDKPAKEYVYLGSQLVAIETQLSGGPQAPSVPYPGISGLSGSPQTFSFAGRDPNGFADIYRIYFVVNPSAGTPQNTCHGFYDRASNGIYLYNDAMTAVTGPLVPGAAGTLFNTQCQIHGDGSSVASSGTDVVLNLKMRLLGTYGSTSKGVYLWVVDMSGLGTGWVQTATWLPPAAYTPSGSGSPSAVGGSPQIFTFTGTDTNGFEDVQRIYFLVHSSAPAQVPQYTCHGFYDRPSNRVFLYDNLLSVLQGPLEPGTAGTLQNSQCIVDAAGSGVISATGASLVVNLKMGLQGSFATTAKNVYIWVVDAAGAGTGWVQTATWSPN